MTYVPGDSLDIQGNELEAVHGHVSAPSLVTFCVFHFIDP